MGNTLSREIAMENTPHLYDTLVRVLSQHATWSDQRHLQDPGVDDGWSDPLGLDQSDGLGAYVVSRAQYAQSTVRRFRRWLDNDKIDVLSLYGPFMQQALADGVSRHCMWPWTLPCCGIRTV